jgi:hypothetical protein
VIKSAGHVFWHSHPAEALNASARVPGSAGVAKGIFRSLLGRKWTTIGTTIGATQGGTMSSVAA